MASANNASDSDGEDLEQTPLETDFATAADHLQHLHKQLDQGSLLEMYGLYKQSTVGVNTTPKPGVFSIQARSKWTAWHDLGDMSKVDAMTKYVDKMKHIDPAWADATCADDKKFGKTKGWMTVSSMEPDDLVPDAEKTLFDHVKEGNHNNVVEIIDANRELLNQLDETGMGLIHWAADRGDENILNVLLTRGADVNVIGADGQTALHYASSCGHLECVKLLIKFGADRTLQDADGATCLEVAFDSAISELLKS